MSWGAEGLHDIALIAAEGEHSAPASYVVASAAGGRVFNATSANGLLYALRTVSGAVRHTHADGHECCMPHLLPALASKAITKTSYLLNTG